EAPAGAPALDQPLRALAPVEAGRALGSDPLERSGEVGLAHDVPLARHPAAIEKDLAGTPGNERLAPPLGHPAVARRHGEALAREPDGGRERTRERERAVAFGEMSERCGQPRDRGRERA